MTNNWQKQRFVVVDVEGNGRQPPEIVEIAVGIVEGGKLCGVPRAWIFKPEQSITWRARTIHGITNAAVESAPSLQDCKPALLDVLGDFWAVAHHAQTERTVLGRVLPEWQPKGVIDTLSLARTNLPGRKSYSLHSLAHDLGLAALNGPSGSRAHRAEYDVIITAQLFLHLANCGAVTDDLAALSRPRDSQDNSSQGSLL